MRSSCATPPTAPDALANETPPAAAGEVVPANTLPSTAESVSVSDAPSPAIAPAPSLVGGGLGAVVAQDDDASRTSAAPPPAAIAPPPTGTVPVSRLPLIVTPRSVSFALAPLTAKTPPFRFTAAFVSAPVIVVTLAPPVPSMVTSPGISGSASFGRM